MDDIISEISVSSHSGVTLTHQVKQQIIWLIASGKLKPGDRLPSVRRLAERLAINMHTVRNAYLMLENDGLVATRQGWGTKVLAIDPVQIARSQNNIRSNTIGVIIPSLFNPFYHQLLRGIQEIADTDQSLIFICNTQDEPTEAWRYVNQLISKQVDGIIVASLDIEQFVPEGADPTAHKSIGAPYVCVDGPDTCAYSITLDLETVGYEATNHLIEHGHRRIGLITFGYAGIDFRPEDHGYRRALENEGIQYDPSLVIHTHSFGGEAGAQGVQQLLRLPQPPSAIFAITDLMAQGVLQALNAAGKHVPRDIALIGFNDIPLASSLTPPLTTISAPGIQMGTEAMEMLFCLIDGREPKQRHIVFPTKLIKRQSCGCLGELEDTSDR